MRTLTPKEIEDFCKAEAQCFFISESSKSKTVMFKAEDAEVYSSSLLTVSNTMSLPFLTMSKLVEGKHNTEAGFLVEIPNLPFHVGRNYITVKRRNIGKEDVFKGEIEITVNVNRFTLLELTDAAVALIMDNTGNFQT